jgi:predicted ribosome quality control (RQC) complex YloA/Tae2 family protein
LYAAGNVILTDHEYTILSLLRSHKFDETAKIQIKEKYPFTSAAGMTIDSVITDTDIIKKLIAGQEEVVAAPIEEAT